ncbi:tRNA1(Val) (adenine(37)-N6)-methyltransferase [Methylocella silvestris]|uniref:Methyltransferase n=1 Tax=Methylocella silvestris TaxID=199596 RepID=A0A2J7TDV5_METSI|nr:methyltransferase [Methylocella silvestris]PNG24952.1 methyltransferase [Methylocella silvestris]
MAETAGAQPVRADAFLGGKVTLYQSARGHRAGTDAALLAAAAPADFSGFVLDIGAGVGAASIALAATRPGAHIGLVEIDAEAAELARKNLGLNALAERGRVFEADALSPPSRRAAELADESADLVISNPPFLDPARSRASPDEGRRRAHVMREGGPAGVAAWLIACLALTRPGGSCILIHRPDSLAALLAALEGRAGGAVLMPIHPRAGAAAIRILLRARKGSRAPFSIVPGLIIHDESGLTPQSDAIHRGEACLDW